MTPQEDNPTKPRKRENAEKDRGDKENVTKSRKKEKPSRKPKSPKKKEGRKKAPRKPSVGETAFEKTWKATRRFLLYQFRQHWVLICASAFVAMLLMALYFASDTLDIKRTAPTVTDKVTLKFAINGTAIGSVDLGLFGRACPLTTKNFIMLATHEKGFGYKGSIIHTVIPMHMLIGGDITHGNGTGGRSALDTPFENESSHVQHSGPGYLGMLAQGNNRDSSRTSIFYITINAMPRLDRNSVAFGKVLNGMEVIKRIEASDVDDNFKPYGNVTISDTSHEAA